MYTLFRLNAFHSIYYTVVEGNIVRRRGGGKKKITYNVLRFKECYFIFLSSNRAAAAAAAALSTTATITICLMIGYYRFLIWSPHTHLPVAPNKWTESSQQYTLNVSSQSETIFHTGPFLPWPAEFGARAPLACLSRRDNH